MKTKENIIVLCLVAILAIWWGSGQKSASNSAKACQHKCTAHEAL